MATKQRDGIQERKRADGSTSYRAQIRLRGHPPTYRTFPRLTDARRWIERTRSMMRAGEHVSSEADRTTLREALERFLREVVPTKKDRRRYAGRTKAWMKNPLAVRFLSKLRGADFAAYRDERRKAGKAENTIRLDLALISKLYKVAASDWGMEGLRNPIKSVTMPGGSNARERRVTPDEEQKLLAELAKAGPYYAPMASLAIETAMRQGELLALAWSDVDLQRAIAHLRDTKNSEPRDVPLSTRAIEILKALPRPISNAAPLFPISQQSVIRTFRAACTAAEIENLKFHDLRHEATSRICNLLPMHEAMRVTGHKTPSMLMRYYHPKAEDLAKKLA